MAVTIQQQWMLEEMVQSPQQEGQIHQQNKGKWREQRSRKEYPQDPNRVSSSSPHFKQRTIRPGQWIEGHHSPPPWTSANLHKGAPRFISTTCANEIQLPDEDEGADFLALLEACAKKKDLQSGIEVHNDILQKGLLENYSDALVNMYACCGMLSRARELLDMYKCSTALPWSALIAGYAKQGQDQNVLMSFEHMQREGHFPDEVTFRSILKSCGRLKALDKGEQIHEELSKQGFLSSNTMLGNAVLDLYVKCGALTKAEQLFKELPSRDIVSWNAIIAAHSHRGQAMKALKYFEQMQQEGISPNAVTFSSVLKACGSLGAIDVGDRIHKEISREGLFSNLKLGTALADMYVKCGALVKARQVLDNLPFRDAVSWNVLITGYAQKGQAEQALACFEEMQREGLSPDEVTFICILKSCASIGATKKGEEIHSEIDKQGLLGKHMYLGNALVDMYAKCGALEKAYEVLLGLPCRNIVTWNALITGYAQGGQGEQALKCFRQVQLEGLTPNAVTFTCILKACSSIGAIEKGEEIHNEISRQGLLENNIVLGTALVDMYAKCGALAKAQRVLKALPSRDVVSWSALITGYVQQGRSEEALNCFDCMQHEGHYPNAVTFACALKACAIIGAIDKGRQIHNEIDQQGLLEGNVILGTALVDMYAKCGALAKAYQLLKEFSIRDVVSWSALIAAYVHQGHSRQALSCFRQMQHEGLTPDAVTFSSVLNACNQLGLVEDAHMHFMSISTKYGMKPDVDHYACIIDLFGRAGHLDKVVSVIGELPSCKNSLIWSALLGACQIWGDVNIGRWAFEQAMLIDRTDSAAYILMSNIYVAAGMPDEAKKINTMRLEISKVSM